MAKRTKKVQAKLDKIKDLHGRDLDVLKIGKQTVGEIQNHDDHLEARSNKGKIFHVNNLSEALQDLLSEYHLHKK